MLFIISSNVIKTYEAQSQRKLVLPLSPQARCFTVCLSCHGLQSARSSGPCLNLLNPPTLLSLLQVHWMVCSPYILQAQLTSGLFCQPFPLPGSRSHQTSLGLFFSFIQVCSKVNSLKENRWTCISNLHPPQPSTTALPVPFYTLFFNSTYLNIKLCYFLFGCPCPP